MGPFVPNGGKRPWDLEVVSQDNAYADMATRMRRRWESGLCPCNCGLTINELRRQNPDLFNEYEQTGVWSGPTRNA